MKNPYSMLVGAVLLSIAVLPIARPAQADTTSTAILAAAAAAIVGAILTDTNNQPYYVNNGRHVYVSQNTATYYRAHNYRPQSDNRGNRNQRGSQNNRRQHDDRQGH